MILFLVKTIGLLSFAAVGILVAFGATYSQALETGKNSLVMIILGRRGSLLVLTLLTRIRTLFGDSAKARSAKQAYARFALAEKDPDATNGNGICFIGSSTFTYWTNLKRDMAPISSCFNLAFGGSVTGDILEHVDVVARFRPKMIVYYCGANDLSFGSSPADAANGFIQFATRIREKLPNVGIIYLAINLTPLQIANGKTTQLKEINSRVEQFVSRQQNMSFVDANKESRFANHWDWYINDGLHLNDEGHIELSKWIKPAVQEMIRTLK